MQALNNEGLLLIKHALPMTPLSWKKDFFGSMTKIYSGAQQIGYLSENSWSQKGSGFLNDSQYQFNNIGVFNPYTQIIDVKAGKEVGKITYNGMRTKATILYRGKVYDMKYNNIWNTKWMIFDRKGLRMDYQGSSTKGTVYGNGDDALLTLAGLFISGYYRQTTIAIMVAVFVPIYVTLFT